LKDVDFNEVKKVTNIVGVNIVDAWNKDNNKTTQYFDEL